MSSDEVVRKMNLVALLEEDHPDVAPPAATVAKRWSEREIREYFEEGAVPLNDESDCTQPGGGLPQERPAYYEGPQPRQKKFVLSPEGYRARVFEDGIPFRSHGLFPPGDPVLLELAAKPGSRAFEKHLEGWEGPYEAVPQGGWTTGDTAAQAGFDLRMFYQDKAPGEEFGSLIAAARLGEHAGIGAGFLMTAHGGAIESLLDEATAELAKAEWAPSVATIEAKFRIKKPVPLHTTLRIECQVVSISSSRLRGVVTGAVKDAKGEVVLATCEAHLVNLAMLSQ